MDIFYIFSLICWDICLSVRIQNHFGRKSRYRKILWQQTNFIIAHIIQVGNIFMGPSFISGMYQIEYNWQSGNHKTKVGVFISIFFVFSSVYRDKYMSLSIWKHVSRKSSHRIVLWQTSLIIPHIIQIGNIFMSPSFSTRIPLNLN